MPFYYQEKTALCCNGWCKGCVE